ncbi:hypothetical protein JHK82_033290 [Glycine max]|uniref:Uncharacterized protein n=2 Tax=Glycine subgen. Soja TaxID=1462606 RepID=A0A0R0HC60_SOYBN|nr:hypothetical protein JHK87_033231 [Glycine soja]KAG4980053.1 hypothetical protein JHK85_034011 [Glycine max]KAG4985685.1 hypothetical protein JHK86_033376 [Glycine max]KAG5118870.1 hypothetical protein JHK82_033290 [Glycine max]KAG5139862.1 hypothetical protein JHK84_033630 [Glycine max]
MVKASLLFPCSIVLFLVVSTIGFANANACTKCDLEHDCGHLHCFGPRCLKECIDGCCGCNCRPPSKIV